MSLDNTVKKLEEAGLCEMAGRVRGIVDELKRAANDAGWLQKNVKLASVLLDTQLSNIESEINETGKMLNVARRTLTKSRHVSDAEKQAAVTQFREVLKTVPISAVLAGTFLIPLPGAQPILAPIILSKLGLVPAAWSRDSVEKDLSELSALARELKLDGLVAELAELQREVHDLDARVAELMAYVKEHPDWRIFFDENFDNKVTEAEVRRLLARLKRAAARVKSQGKELKWFVFHLDQDKSLESLSGPMTWSELDNSFSDGRLTLVRFGARGWWLPLWALRRELARQSEHLQEGCE